MSHSTEMAKVTNDKMDPGETQVQEALLKGPEQVLSIDDLSQSTKADITTDMLSDVTKWSDEITEQNHMGNVEDCETSCQKEAPALETDQNELNRTESITSSVSDTPSSAGSVYENHLAQRSQDQSDQEQTESFLQLNTKPVNPNVPDDNAVVDEENNSIKYNSALDYQNTLEEYNGHEDHMPEQDQILMEEHNVLDEHNFPEDNPDDQNILEDKALHDQNVLEDNALHDQNVLVDNDQNVLEDNDLNDQNVLEDNDLHDQNVLEDNDLHDQNVLDGQILPEDDTTTGFFSIGEDHKVSEEDKTNEYYINMEYQSSPLDHNALGPCTVDDLNSPEEHNPGFDHNACEEMQPVANIIDLEAIDNSTIQVSIFEEFVKEEASSDRSTESCHEFDQDYLNECLRVEIEPVSSDSETDEKWRAIFSSSINREDDDYYVDSLNLNAQELFIQKVEQKVEENEENDENIQENEGETETTGGPLKPLESCTDYESVLQEHSIIVPTLCHALSKIVEDEEELSKTVNVDTSKKVPLDYCVIQETKSENVSTEHVDFRVARKQWLKMEEETKGQVHQPTVKHSTCQGGHNFMYTPVRNIERPKKEPEPDNCLIHYSPCSEDSGVDDSSYRSPNDDPETPIEREIRLAMEREENLRRERGIFKPCDPDELTQTNVKPTILIPGRMNQEVEEKRKMFETKEDGGKLPRSPSNQTPSFIITSSPSKSSACCEVSSNNVIILETSNLIIRSTSEFCLNSAGQEAQESTFLNNPFFKLRSRSTQSLIDEEIKMVRQRDEELKKQRESLYAMENKTNALDSLAFDKSDLPERCKSSPSSPMKSAHKMDRSIVSCDNRFPDSFSGVRRKSAMAMRWEEGAFAPH